MLSPAYSNQDLTPWKHLRFALLGVLLDAPTTKARRHPGQDVCLTVLGTVLVPVPVHVPDQSTSRRLVSLINIDTTRSSIALLARIDKLEPYANVKYDCGLGRWPSGAEIIAAQSALL